MYDTILVATDGSGPANRAVTHAIEAAERYDAELRAVYVVDTTRFSEPARGNSELETNEDEAYGGRQLDEVTDRAGSVGVGVETKCCHGVPWQEIIAYGDETDADLLVLGYHGHSHTRTDTIGSVTDRVVQNAGRPVLVV